MAYFEKKKKEREERLKKANEELTQEFEKMKIKERKKLSRHQTSIGLTDLGFGRKGVSIGNSRDASPDIEPPMGLSLSKINSVKTRKAP